MASSSNAKATTPRSAAAARAATTRRAQQPVADGGPAAVDLLEPQADRSDARRGVGLLRDHEGKPVTLGGAGVLAFDEGASGVVRVGPRHGRDGGDERIVRRPAHHGQIGHGIGPEHDRRARKRGDTQRWSEGTTVELVHRSVKYPGTR